MEERPAEELLSGICQYHMLLDTINAAVILNGIFHVFQIQLTYSFPSN
jgi:hypothetical protein